MPEVTLPRFSRYKDTEVHADDQGRALFGLFVGPAEFDGSTTRDRYRTHVVEPRDVGMLDRVASIYYGTGFEGAWWVIALVNGIMDPERDMIAGMLLKIPAKERVVAYTSRDASL